MKHNEITFEVYDFLWRYAGHGSTMHGLSQNFASLRKAS
jgi:hypothetical protein